MPPMSADATSALLNALRRRFGKCIGFVLEEVRSRSWASATFVGARHEVRFRLEGERAEAAARDFVSKLESAEFKLRGHLLADIALACNEGTRLSIEALTVEDG